MTQAFESPFSGAADRNKRVIFETLKVYLAQFTDPSVLEIGSATGQHGIYFTENDPSLTWHFCDQANWEDHLKSVTDGQRRRGPWVYVAGKSEWPKADVNVVYSTNTLHIMSWAEAQIFLEQVADSLIASQIFFYYGPFNEGDKFTSSSNQQFHEKLQSENSLMGLRDRFKVQSLLESRGLKLIEAIKMPANNFSLVFKK